MSIDSPQKRPGTNFIRSSGGSDKGSPSKDPLSGENRNTQTSTHVKFSRENITEDKGGRIIEGQKLRGYVLNDSGPSGGETKDATVAADGTRRVKDIG